MSIKFNADSFHLEQARTAINSLHERTNSIRLLGSGSNTLKNLKKVFELARQDEYEAKVVQVQLSYLLQQAT